MNIRNLSPHDLERYRNAGFMIYGALLESGELRECRSHVDEMIRTPPAGQRPDNIEAPHLHDEYFLKPTAHPWS